MIPDATVRFSFSSGSFLNFSSKIRGQVGPGGWYEPCKVTNLMWDMRKDKEAEVHDQQNLEVLESLSFFWEGKKNKETKLTKTFLELRPCLPFFLYFRWITLKPWHSFLINPSCGENWWAPCTKSCCICLTCYRWVGNLQVHVLMHKNTEIALLPPSVEEKIWQCLTWEWLDLSGMRNKTAEIPSRGFKFRLFFLQMRLFVIFLLHRLRKIQLTLTRKK